jgi:NAD(P)-dependent dehydrogenase (short-subunit alcohol dehydrogenase family)
MMFDFTDKVVLITGAAGNLGSATARAFSSAGARLVLADRSFEHLEHEFPEGVESADMLFVTGDLTNSGAVQGMVHEAFHSFGQLDVLVNIAGGYRAGAPVHETPTTTWDFMLDLNARTVLNTCRAAIPYMIEQGSGKIVNVAARAALKGSANQGAYVVSKSAVIRLTETMADELRELGINVNCILPGTLDTPQNRAERPDADYSKWVSPEAMADVFLFLASEAARAIHGAAIPVYGLS